MLDAGCGIGVLGICAARALGSKPGLKVRAQDRDELARGFTEYNATRNGVPASVLSAHTEPLLAADPPWDLILSNIPAKTGEPVLLDFIARSAGLLSKEGSVMLVVVKPLSDLLRSRIRELKLPLFHEENGKEHTVLAYGGGVELNSVLNSDPQNSGDDFLKRRRVYFRCAGDFELEDIAYHIDAIHGVADFDTPSGVVQVAAKLVKRLALRPAAGPILVHEPDQGHFPAWLLRYRGAEPPGMPQSQTRTGPLVLSGRNILALEAARQNSLLALGDRVSGGKGASGIILAPAVDLFLDRERLSAAADQNREQPGGGYSFIALFPELVPQTNRLGAYWEGLAALLTDGGMAVIALPSSAAERFDREKPMGFTRLGDIKRQGFRALGYERR